MGFSWPFFPSSAPCREALRCAGGDGLPYLIIMQSTVHMLVCESVRLFAATWGVCVFALPVCKSRRTRESFIIVWQIPAGRGREWKWKMQQILNHSPYWYIYLSEYNPKDDLQYFLSVFFFPSLSNTEALSKLKNSEVIMTTATLHYSLCRVRTVYDCCEHRGCVAVSLLR